MTLAELQKDVDNWIKKYGVRYFDEKTNALLLTEEVGELCRIIARKYGEQSFKKKSKEEQADQNIGDEIGDILFVITCLANQMGYSLEDIMRENMNKKTKRDNQRHFINDKLR